MFVNLFIGNPPTKVDSEKKSEEQFSLKEMNGKRLALFNGANGRYLTFPKSSSEKMAGASLNQSECSSYIIDQDTEICLGFTNCAALPGFREKIAHDYVNLNPRLVRFYTNDDDKDISQIFVNIDTSLFTPLLYEIPDGVCVKDTYHYAGHHYGFILEAEDHISATEASNSIKVYGYDHRLPETHEMARYHMIEFSIDARFVTEEELEEIKEMDPDNFNPDYKYTKHVVSVSHSGMNKKERKKFFRMRSMYHKSTIPRTLVLTGPLFTSNIIGTIPTKAARELIETAKKVNQVPMDTEVHYHYIPKEKFNDEEDWYTNGVVSKLRELAEQKIHAVTITDDIKINLSDIKETKIQQELALHEDGSITSVISNR